MKKRALILSGIPWNTTIQRHHNLAFLLDKIGYEVIFVEKIPSSKFTVKKLIQRIIKNHRINENSPNIDKDSITVINQRFINPLGGLFWIINKYRIKQLIKKTGKEFDVVFNYLPVNTTLYILEEIIGNVIIYDCVRDFENWGGYLSNINKMETKIISISDIILVDSYYLAK